MPLQDVARAPLSSSPPRLQSSLILHLLPRLLRGTLSPTLPFTPSIIPHTHMLTFLKHTISTPPSLTLSPTPSSCHLWVGQQQWLALRGH